VDIVGEAKNKLFISFFFGNHCTEKDQEVDHGAPTSTNLHRERKSCCSNGRQKTIVSLQCDRGRSGKV